MDNKQMQINCKPKYLHKLFDDTLDELEITFDVYFALAQYKKRCVHVLRCLITSGMSTGNILVLGSNESAFTSVLKKAGYAVDSLGLDNTLNSSFDRNHCLTFNSALEKAIRNIQHEYDSIICDDIFQYFESPSDSLSVLNKLLKPGGVLILSTPNATRGTSRLRLMFGKNVFPTLNRNTSPDGKETVTLRKEYTIVEVNALLSDIGFGLISSKYIIGKNVNANVWPPMPVKEYFLQLLFLGVQRVAAPLRNYLLVAARKPLFEVKRT